MKVKPLTIDDITDQMVLVRHFGINGIFINDELVDSHEKVELPTQEQIDAARPLVLEEMQKYEYSVMRKVEYPKIAQQLDMLWHAIDNDSLDKTSDFYQSLKAVKDKYPKDS